MTTNAIQSSHIYSTYFAPRGRSRIYTLGMQIAQLYLSPFDQIIGFIGEAGSGKSVLIKGMFPGIELTNDDDGVNVRPLPLLEQEYETGFFTPHTYHLDIRFETGFHQLSELADAVRLAVRRGKRIIIEHFDLIYPLLGVNANLLIGVGEQIVITRPNLFGPLPQELCDIVYPSLAYRLMAHSAEDLCEYAMTQEQMLACSHGDIRHGFVLEFNEHQPDIDIPTLEARVNELIRQELPIDYYVTIDMQALVEMVDNFGGIEVYIPHDMSFAGSVLKQGYRNLDGASAEFFVRCRHGEGYANSDIDRLNMQRYFYAGLFKRVRSMGVTDVIAQLPLIFNNYIHTDMDLTTIAKMLVSFTRIDSANIMLAQTPVFMGVPNVGKTSSFDGYSCVVPDAGSIAALLNQYFCTYTGPIDVSEMNLVTDDWPHGTASTDANVQYMGRIDKESDDAILNGNTDLDNAKTTDELAASSAN